MPVRQQDDGQVAAGCRRRDAHLQLLSPIRGGKRNRADGDRHRCFLGGDMTGLVDEVVHGRATHFWMAKLEQLTYTAETERCSD